MSAYERIAQGQALEGLAERWERAERLRRFIAAVGAIARARVSPGAPQDRWGPSCSDSSVLGLRCVQEHGLVVIAPED